MGLEVCSLFSFWLRGGFGDGKAGVCVCLGVWKARGGNVCELWLMIWRVFLTAH